MGGVVKVSEIEPEVRPSRQSPLKQTKIFRQFLQWLASADKWGEIPVGEAFEFTKQDLAPIKSKDVLESARLVIKEELAHRHKLKAQVIKRKYAGKIYVCGPDAG